MRRSRQSWRTLGAAPVSEERARPKPLRVQLKSEIDKWGPIIKEAGVYGE